MSEHWLSDPTRLWPDYRPTRLIELSALARRAGVARVLVKAENERPLGNFKALGGMVAGLRGLARITGAQSLDELRHRCRAWPTPLRLVCASDGNHGLSVAAAAQHAGVVATVFLPEAVGSVRAARIRALGGDVVTVAGSYDDAVLAARDVAARGDGLLIADTSDDATDPAVIDVMAGYGLIARELAPQLRACAATRVSHLFVQAGVGGLAAALADGLHAQAQAPGRLIVVEPEAAACVARALARGKPVQIDGDLDTAAQMLSCGLASASALALLLWHRAQALSVDEPALRRAPRELLECGGPRSTPSGAAGAAGLLHAADDRARRELHGLDSASTVLLIVTEGAIEGAD
ncbi:pyridoxal-phosphate dependent enzyme [Lysobacter capsici]|nr:pyridoxal-phosphate dependent enzyme [Lysobacter capsici]